VVSNIEELRAQLPERMAACLVFFPGIDRTSAGWEQLEAAQQCLPDDATKDAFAAEFSALAQIWEALSPDAALVPFADDYRWLTQVYESVKPPSGHGKLLWHALGAKTIDLINQNVHLDGIVEDLETLVLDTELLGEILDEADALRRGKAIEFRLIPRLRRHLNDPRFVALGERLERIRQQHEQGFLNSLEFLKAMLELAKESLIEVTQAEAFAPIYVRLAYSPA